jgi:hypothetical protein
MLSMHEVVQGSFDRVPISATQSPGPRLRSEIVYLTATGLRYSTNSEGAAFFDSIRQISAIFQVSAL